MMRSGYFSKIAVISNLPKLRGSIREETKMYRSVDDMMREIVRKEYKFAMSSAPKKVTEQLRDLGAPNKEIKEFVKFVSRLDAYVRDGQIVRICEMKRINGFVVLLWRHTSYQDEDFAPCVMSTNQFVVLVGRKIYEGKDYKCLSWIDPRDSYSDAVEKGERWIHKIIGVEIYPDKREIIVKAETSRGELVERIVLK